MGNDETIQHNQMYCDDEGDENIEISLNALTGSVAFKTIRIQGFIKNTPISILIDSGSTHNFVDENIAKRLQCKQISTRPLGVTVANGARMYSRSVCAPLIWRMHGHEFQHSKNFKIRWQ